MSDDEEMSDLSQVATQSGQLSTSFSNVEQNEIEENDPWGRIVVYKIKVARLGTRPVNYFTEKFNEIDLTKEKTTFGRKGDYKISSEQIQAAKLDEISNIHFTIWKNDVNEALCPVFIEDSSTNGTFCKQQTKCDLKFSFNNRQRINEKYKRRILDHREIIFIEKQPTICFEFFNFRLPIENRDIPEDIQKEFHIGKVLGEGACGTVYFAQRRATCEPYAVKYTTSKNKENNCEIMMREVNILKKLKHPCILEFHKVKTYKDSVAIFIEYMQGGNLLSSIQRNGHFSENFSKFIFYQICCGVEYLHDQNVTHRDLKPDNILLSTTDKYTLVKISDFGLSKCTNSNSMLKTQCGTRYYLAPEVKTGRYTNKVDIWSIGVILFNCLTGDYPFRNYSNCYNLEYHLTFSQPQWEFVSEEGENIVREVLTIDENQRPSIKKLLNERNWLSKEDAVVRRAREIIDNQTNQII